MSRAKRITKCACVCMRVQKPAPRIRALQSPFYRCFVKDQNISYPYTLRCQPSRGHGSIQYSRHYHVTHNEDTVTKSSASRNRPERENTSKKTCTSTKSPLHSFFAKVVCLGALQSPLVLHKAPPYRVFVKHPPYL